MKYYLFLSFIILSTSSSFAKEFRIVQIDKTFMDNLTEKQIEDVFDDPTIEENHKLFKIEAKVGDTLHFENRDEVNHNVSGSVDDTKVFDVKLQKPGKANDKTITLKDKGEYTVKCAIHPKMKITIKVD